MPFAVTNVGLEIELPVLPIYASSIHYVPLDDYQGQQQGWIGVLNCSLGDGWELVGIILRILPIPRGSDAEVERGECLLHENGKEIGAVIVGVRTAMQARRKKVLIFNHDSHRIHRLRHEPLAYAVQKSRALREAGYEVSHTGTSSTALVSQDSNRWHRWDATEHIFTAWGENINDGAWFIEFCNDSSLSRFTIFVRKGAWLLRDGPWNRAPDTMFAGRSPVASTWYQESIGVAEIPISHDDDRRPGGWFIKVVMTQHHLFHNITEIEVDLVQRPPASLDALKVDLHLGDDVVKDQDSLARTIKRRRHRQ